MHLAAAFDKPCVVVAGGREEPWWEHYADDYGAFGPVCAAVQMPHRFLHTVGVLDCCSYKGCWKNRTVPITPEDTISRKLKLCVDPVREEEQAVPRCMSLVTPDFVVDAVQSYYTSGAIAPYGVATRRFSLPHMEPRGVVRVQGPVKHVMFPDTEPDTHDGTVFTAPEHFNDRLGIDFTKEPSLVKPQKPEGATIPGERRQGVLDDVAYDHPFVGGIFTVCVLCYGHYPELARRCLEGVLRTVPAHRLDLRVGANECCAETLRYLRELPASKLYIYSHNHLKYPVMREMFHDERAPLSGKYVVWFDDDSYVVDDLWAVKLAKEIAANHTQGCRLYGMKFFHDIAPYAKDGHCPDQWFKSATWWRGKHLRVRNKQIAAANGSCIDFVAGGFWALCTKVIKEMHVPDVRLGLSGGDIVIGEQVRQGGHHLKNFNEHKKLVHSSGHDPRGLSPRTPKDKLFPWAPQ
jgi:hypothetical protein